MAKRLKYLALLALSLSLFMPCLGDASIMIADSLQVTDVTPVQFSVVWGTSEPATGSVNVFSDADGTVPVTDAVVHFESAYHPPAEDIGVMKVRVTNLKPNTQYFFQISTTAKNSGAVSLYPDAPPYLEVTTELGSVIVRNDVLVQQVSIGQGQSTQGTIAIAEVGQASYPVTGWAGDGVPGGWVAIDTNNFYDKDTRANLELLGGESISLTYFCGLLGKVETNDTVPAESGGIQQVSVKASLPSSASGGGSLSSTSSSGGGGSCFIATTAFGSPLDPHVEILRTFRDRYLTRHSIGRKLIEYYYRHSPEIAEYIKEHKNLKLIIRYSLIPVVFLSYLFMKQGLVLLSFVAAVILTCICTRSSLLPAQHRHD